MMRLLAILCVVAAAFTFPLTTTAQGKSAKAVDEGAIRNKCRAEVVGLGVSAQAQFRACVQRAKGR